MLLGQVMDLNYLTWILAIDVEDQKQLHTIESFVQSFSELWAAMQGLPHPK